jgi:hypothetical protein
LLEEQQTVQMELQVVLIPFLLLVELLAVIVVVLEVHREMVLLVALGDLVAIVVHEVEAPQQLGPVGVLVKTTLTQVRQ